MSFDMDEDVVDITDYDEKEKLICCAWKIYQEHKLFDSDEVLIQLLCQYYYLDCQILTELCKRSCKVSNRYLDRESFYLNDLPHGVYNAEICQGFMKLLFLKDIIEKMKIGDFNQDSIETFNNAVLWVTLINGDIGTYLSKKRGYFDKEHVMQTDWIRSLNHAVKSLSESNMKIWNSEQIKNLLRLYFRDIEGIYKQLAVILVICIVDTIPILAEEHQEIFDHVIFPLIDIFRESEFLDLSLNSKPINTSIPIAARSKTDNTTIAEFTYCYKNGDMYTIRFDTAHKGMESFHFNIQSFGNDNQIFPSYEVSDELEKEDYIKHPDNNLYYIKEKVLKEKIQAKNVERTFSLYDQQHRYFEYSDENIEFVMQLFGSLISPFANKRDLSIFNLEDIYTSARIAEGIEFFMLLQKMEYNLDNKDILHFIGAKEKFWSKLGEFWEILLDCDNDDECASYLLDIIKGENC